MGTRKLYYEDCHLAQATGRVCACERVENGWEIVLDATVFYPEGGGQACDLGTISGVRVRDVRERGDEIVHLCDAPFEIGAVVEENIDHARRFHLMQQHSGEHIVSGIIHARYGYHNVGFHMGAEGMVIDFDGVFPAQALREIELEANRAVWENIPIVCEYPSEEALVGLAYRTKKALAYPVRIVTIGNYDCCACCGVHVASTGEIGVIKLLSSMGLRGGTRIEMVCGDQAYAVLRDAFDQNRLVSQAFSAKWQETGAAAQRMNDQLAEQQTALATLWKRIFASIAGRFENTGNVLYFENALTSVQLRELADAIAERCGGVAAVFSGSDAAGFAYALVTRTGDLRTLGAQMNAALSGRGGGKPIFQQGRVQAKRCDIEAFFANMGGF